jgi:Arc/MetJ-type ribon-helix-helix transcriptional regulator
MMPKIATEIPSELSREIDRIVRDGWFPDEASLVREAVSQFVGHRTYLGDSPRMLHRFGADALNESKPDTALKFVDRAVGLIDASPQPDLGLYQQLIEMRVQILLVLDRKRDAIDSLRSAKEKLPNNPFVLRWLDRLETAGH